MVSKFVPNPDDYEVQDRNKLNEIRLKYFLAPGGSNKEYFARITKHVVDSFLDWYLPVNDSRIRLEDLFLNDREFNDFIKKREIEDKLLEVDLRFDDENLVEVKNAVDGCLTSTEANSGIPLEFPRRLIPIENILSDLDYHTDPSIRFNNLHFGEIHPQGFIPSLVGGIVSKLLNQNVIAQKVSPKITYMEKRLVEWLSEIIGFPKSESKYFCGNIVSGGTIANLTAMIVGRNSKLTFERRDIKPLIEETIFEETGNRTISIKYVLGKKIKLSSGEPELISPSTVGMNGIMPYLLEKGVHGIAMFISERSHYSLKEKLANVSGVGNEYMIEVKTDGKGRMIPRDLEAKIQEALNNKLLPIAVLATAGTTEQGAIDPLREIGEIVEKNNMYYHVDAAHGGAFLISDNFKEKFDGIELADSVTIDGHKMFFSPYPCGGIVFKDPQLAFKHIKQVAPYLGIDKEGNEEHYNSGSQTIEGSRGADGILQLYAGLRSLGQEGFTILFDHLANMTRYLHDRIISSNDFEIEVEPELNILLYRYEPKNLELNQWLDRKEIFNEVNKRIPKEAYKLGKFYVGTTEIDGVNYIRAVIVHPYIETGTVDEYLNYVREIGKRVTKEIINQKLEGEKWLMIG